MKKQSTIGPSHTGAAKPGFFVARGNAKALSVHHQPAATTNAKYRAAHVGAPKAHLDVPLHNSATARQLAGVGAGGMAHPVESGGQPGNVLAKPPLPKNYPPIRGSHGMAAPDHEDANQILAEGLPSYPKFRGKGC